MKNIYSPADIERLLESILGRPADIARLPEQERALATERRNVFVDAVGAAVAAEVLTLRSGSIRPVVVFAGDDLNGAYAFAAATALHDAGCPASVYFINVANTRCADVVRARTIFLETAGQGFLFETVDMDLQMPEFVPGMIVVDGLFGREYKKPLRGGYQVLARKINASEGFVVSIDLPSGMTPDLSVGMINNNIVHASLTLTLVGPSLAFYMPENADLRGRWKALPLPYPRDLLHGIRCRARLVDAAGVRKIMPRRNPFASKADLGTALVCAGSYGMLGAAVLATRGALRSGCGKVVCRAPRCAFYVMQTAVPAAMFETDGEPLDIHSFDSDIEADAVAIGPGIGRSEATVLALDSFLKYMRAKRRPVILDADALNCISRRPSMLDYLPPRSILTPHAGEFDRIFGSHPTASTRLLKAIEAAAHYNVVIVLKGHYTQTVWPDGSVLVNSSGTEALATAGSGDVLTGLMAGLMAQKMPPEYAAVAAVYIHGLAGKIAAASNGIAGTTSEDIADALGPAIQSLTEQQQKR